MTKKEVFQRDYNEQTITEDFSRVTFIYDFWANLTEKKAQKKVLDYANISGKENILEVAVGTGMLFQEIVSKNSNGNNIGIDLSPDMLGKAKGRMMRTNSKNYELKVGNALKLPFDDNQFDLLINNFMLDLLPESDFTQILMEFKRVLKPKGKVVISTMSFGTKKVNHFWGWLAKHFPRLLTGCRPISIGNYLKDVGYNNINQSIVSQNTFPAEILSAIK